MGMRKAGFAGGIKNSSGKAGALEQKRNCDMAGPTDTSETLTGKRNRSTDTADELSATQWKRRRVSHLRLAFVKGKEIVKGHAPWRGPEMKARWDATHAFPAEGVDAAISAQPAKKSSLVWPRN